MGLGPELGLSWKPNYTHLSPESDTNTTGNEVIKSNHAEMKTSMQTPAFIIITLNALCRYSGAGFCGCVSISGNAVQWSELLAD